MGRIARTLALVMVVAALLATLTWFPWTPGTLFGRELRNFGHFPLFAVIGAALYALSRLTLGERLGTAGHVVVAAIAAAALGVGSEVAQYFGPRDAAFDDLARDIAGAGSALAWIVAGRLSSSRPGVAFLLRAGAVVTVLASAVPTVAQLDAERGRDARFPLLLGFESSSEMRFVLTRAAGIERAPAPPGWERIGTVGHARYSATDYPQITLREPVPDWRGFDRLCVDLYAESAAGTRLVLAINDEGWSGAPTDRLRRRFELARGAQTVCIDLSDPRPPSGDRTVRLDAVRSVNLFGVEPEHPFEFWIDDLRLEMPSLPSHDTAAGQDDPAG